MLQLPTNIEEVAQHPIWTAILITTIIMVMIMFMFLDEDIEWKKFFRGSMYLLLVNITVLSYHYKVLNRQSAAKTANTLQDRVVTGTIGAMNAATIQPTAIRRMDGAFANAMPAELRSDPDTSSLGYAPPQI